MGDLKGFLYLIPTTLGDNEPLEVLPYSVRTVIEELDWFIVENEKTARVLPSRKRCYCQSARSGLQVRYPGRLGSALGQQRQGKLDATGSGYGSLGL